jgi:hypothetical protein
MFALVLASGAAASYGDDRVSGTYVEARTCQVYTGPCFANGEIGSVGRDAIMTWSITDGNFQGVSLDGLSVSVIVKTSHTLGFNGFDDAKTTQAMIVVDELANSKQAAAIEAFALHQTGLKREQVVDVQRAKIHMDFQFSDLTAKVQVGNIVNLSTRKARPNDCICSNESAYYPPLTKLKGFVPGVTMIGDVTARKLSTRWSIPDSRTAYLGTFEADVGNLKLASNL